MLGELFKRNHWLFWLAFASLCILGTAFFFAQESRIGHPAQTFTSYPPSVYMGLFQPCSSESPCTRIDEFHVNPVPKGCCLLEVTNGDGLGKTEVNSFEVSLNGTKVIRADHSQHPQAAVNLQPSNTIEVILTGEPNSKVFVFISYDPRQSK
jgi:hypothetical protein